MKKPNNYGVVKEPTFKTTHVRVFIADNGAFTVYASDQPIADSELNIVTMKEPVYAYNGSVREYKNGKIYLDDSLTEDCLFKTMSITEGKGAGQESKIIEQTEDSITVFPALTVKPDTHSNVKIIIGEKTIPLTIFKACIIADNFVDSVEIKQHMDKRNIDETPIDVLKRCYKTENCGLMLENYIPRE